MKPAPAPRAEGNFLRCTAGGWQLLLEMSRLGAIESPDRLQRNPRGGQPLGWLLDSRGEVPVFDFADLLGAGSRERSEPEAILRLGEGPRAWALAVDALAHPVQAEPADRQHLPLVEGKPLSTFCREVVWVEQRPLPVLDLAALRRSPSAQPEEAPRSRPRPTRPSGQATGHRSMAGGQRVLLFSTGSNGSSAGGARPHLFGVGLRQVAEVLNPVPLVPVPGAVAFLRGLAAWRRRPVPVLDLSRRLDLGEGSPAPSHRLLILRSPRGGAYCGIEVRPELRVESLPLPCRPLGDEPFGTAPIFGAFDLTGETLIIPDVGALVQGAEPDPDPATGGGTAAQGPRHKTAFDLGQRPERS